MIITLKFYDIIIKKFIVLEAMMKEHILIKIKDVMIQAETLQYTAPNQAIELFEQALSIAKKHELKSETAYAYLGISHAARSKTDTKQMVHNGFKALDLFEELNDSFGKARALNIIGISYFYNGMYEHATKFILKSVALSKTIGNNKLLAALYNNLGEVFREAEDYKVAIDYYEMAIDACGTDELKTTRGVLLSNIGEVLSSQGKYKEASTYLERALVLMEGESAFIVQSEAETRLGKVCYCTGNKERAKILFKQALIRLKEAGNKFYIVETLIHSAELYAEEELDRSYRYLEKALQYAESSSSRKKMSTIYKMYADLYELEDNFKMAYDYFRRYHYLEQEIKTSVLGDTLEVLKLELSRMENATEIEEIREMREHFEAEIAHQSQELNKIQALNRELQDKVFRDALTRINNRSYLDNHLKELFKQAINSNKHILLFMIDIDSFKAYNDFWGHLKGDDCLIKVAHELQKIQTEYDDVLGRYGGEEFIYCSIGHDLSSAKKLGEQLRSSVEALNIQYDTEEANQALTITIGGIVIIPSKNLTLNQLIDEADRALYKGKNSGRNKVIISSVLGGRDEE